VGDVTARPPAATFRATTEDDLPELGRLWNDGAVMRWVGFPDGLAYDQEALDAWYERMQGDPHARHFVVRETEIGFCGELFYRIDPAHRRAVLDIKLVPGAQGRGIATHSLSRLIEHVFERHSDVDAVWTEPRADNVAARALYTRCGLVEASRPSDLPAGASYWELRRPR